MGFIDIWGNHFLREGTTFSETKDDLVAIKILRREAKKYEDESDPH